MSVLWAPTVRAQNAGPGDAPPTAPTSSPAPAAPTPAAPSASVPVAPSVPTPVALPAPAPAVPAPTSPPPAGSPAPIALEAAPKPATPAPDPRLSLVHIGSSYPGTWLELRSRIDPGDWQRVCLAPCDRALVVDGSLARVTAPGMTTSNAFRIDPGQGVELVRVDGGSAKARTLGILGLAIGIPVTLGGGALYSYGNFAERDGMRTSGAVVLGVGALAVLASLPFLLAGATTVRDSRGSAIARSAAATAAF